MDKELVIVVPTEEKAYEALTALERLDNDASIELYSATVVAKEADGRLTRKTEKGDLAGLGTALGIPLGALVGLLAGPVGAAAGAAIAGSLGTTRDIVYSGIGGEFLRDVSEHLKPGTYAVIARVWEDWTMPIDAALKDVGATVFRTSTHDIVKAQLQSKVEELKAEQEAEEAALAKAREEHKAKLEANIREARERQAAQRERMQKRAKEIQDALDAEVASVRAKIAKSQAEAKERHEQHAKKLSRFAEMQKKAFHELFS